MIAKWENLTRDEIAAIDKQSAIVFLPTSATEQHGAHLPVGTDSIILATLIDMIVDQRQSSSRAAWFSRPSCASAKATSTWVSPAR